MLVFLVPHLYLNYKTFWYFIEISFNKCFPDDLEKGAGRKMACLSAK